MLSRRDFLKAAGVGVTSIALFSIAGCGTDNEPDPIIGTWQLVTEPIELTKVYYLQLIIAEKKKANLVVALYTLKSADAKTGALDMEYTSAETYELAWKNSGGNYTFVSDDVSYPSTLGEGTLTFETPFACLPSEFNGARLVFTR